MKMHKLQRIQKEFAQRQARIARLTLGLAAYTMLVLGLHFLQITSIQLTIALFIGSLAYGLVVHLRIWRCPACNGHLGKLYIGLKAPKYCPQCGVRLVNES